ncbi:MAG TPA: hypothetical protein VL098_09260 [Flavipsychrobacter sp.]|nr:hypothetical protein [Flavipsychrobacter sp.]
MKKTFFLAIAAAIGLSSCESSPDKTKSENISVEENLKNIEETTAEKGSAGSGIATARVGDQEIKVEGVCGAVTSMGSTSIVINDKNQASNAFTISFQGTELPAATKTYTVGGENEKDDEVKISFLNFKDNNMSSWDSKKGAGTITLEVNGSDIKCTFNDISLEPAQMYNKAPLDKTAKLSGQFSLTR